MPKKKPSKAESQPVGDPAQFEQSFAQLEAIVADMEGDRIPLEDLLKNYEKGTRLLQQCQAHISTARERIEEIAAKAKNGEVGLEPFDPESGESTKTAGKASAGSQAKEKPISDDDIKLF